MNLRVEPFAGSQITEVLDDLARLRITVFREWPYLYEGSPEYESEYLRSYIVEQAVVAVAFDGNNVIGASTALPLTAHADAVLPALHNAGIDPKLVYYFGESVLLPEYRGKGIGHRFFDIREQSARTHGYAWAAFCAVVRPESHPLRPQNHVPHDAFWTKRGFIRHPEIVCQFSWKDVGDATESAKDMVFWLKDLGKAQ